MLAQFMNGRLLLPHVAHDKAIAIDYAQRQIVAMRVRSDLCGLVAKIREVLFAL